MNRLIIAAIALSTIGTALAQQPPQIEPDAAFMKKAIAALQSQRNEALDRAVGAEARLAVTAEELQKVQIELRQLKMKSEAPKAADPPAQPKKE